MNAKDVAHKEISCEEAKGFIGPTAKSTNHVQWGRLLQHLRGCQSCLGEFKLFHQDRLMGIIDDVVKRECSAEHCHYPLTYEIVMCFPKEMLAEYQNGDVADDEKTYIEQHLHVCLECKRVLEKL